jgi:hypothetical protein
MSPITEPALAIAPVTSLYAALSALLYLALSLRVVRLRMKLGQPFGDAGSDGLTRAVRVHGHFAEYMPLALVLLLLLEMTRWPAWALHGYGILLLASRLVHAIGLMRVPEHLGWRLAAMVITLHLFAGAALGLLVAWWRG